MDASAVIAEARAVSDRLGRQIEFLLELDKLKGVERRNRLVDNGRYENTAEHSWHLAMLALVLGDLAGPDVDVARAVRMLLVHDIVEIDAGDIFIYDEVARTHKSHLEAKAADRVFGLLPPELGGELRELWEEYEARATPTAAFAYAVDRLQPLLLNAASGGGSWVEHGIAESQVRNVNGPIAEGSADLWALASSLIDRAVADGLLSPD